MSTSGVTLLTQEERDLLYESMFRITDGLPAHELNLIVKEAADCEAALEKEIELLEASLAPPLDKSKKSQPGDDEESTKPPPVPTSSTTSNTASVPPASSIPLHIPIIPPEYDSTSNMAQNYLPSADQIVKSELSPLDRYFTVSALLGRLREPFDTPPPPHSGLFQARQAALAAAEKKKKNPSGQGVNGGMAEVRKAQGVKKYRRIMDLKSQNKIYTLDTTHPSLSLETTAGGATTIVAGVGDTTAMLALVKRISNHRTATVFRRAVNPLEAPGYTDRILFPIDLTLIKKMVLCGYIRTFEELHQQIGLICHNCVKFNGRDSDYSMLTREFETYVDDSFLDFMQKQQDKAAAAASTNT